MFLRSDMADIRLIVDGEPIGDSWATAEGGALESDTQKTRPGAMGDEVDLGGPSSRGDITLTTQFSDVMAVLHKKLENAVRNDAPAIVGWTFLGRGRVALGTTHTVRGVMKSAALPDISSVSPEAGMYTVVVACHEVAG